MNQLLKLVEQTIQGIHVVTVWMLLIIVSRGASEALQGSLARCSAENEVVSLPILVGNPCITCRCQEGNVICTREHCPAIKCHGKVERVLGQCCPSCFDSSTCVYENGKYKNGDRWFKRGCQICRCTNGSVTCERQRCTANLNCPKGKKPGLIPGSCCLQCIEVTGVCTSYGDPHYQTFDGKMYNFQGNCRYVLSADRRHGNFTVRVRNERRHTRSLAWAKSLVIHVGKTIISLHRGLRVKVNRSDVRLPYMKLPFLQITKKNFMVIVLTSLGLEVLWDGDSYIEVHVPKRFNGQTCGLCGNFNGIPSDDFTLKNGNYATSAKKFGESWAVGRRRNNCERAPAPPIDTAVTKCRRSPLHHWRARKRCWPIKSHFSNCHKIVKPHKYYKSCITDVCACLSKRCECEALLAYARACRRMGVDVKWGRRRACGITCKGGTMFDDCVPACKRTCNNKNDPTVACPNQHCIPGCRCPAGHVWGTSRNRCLPSWMCPPPINALHERSLGRKS